MRRVLAGCEWSSLQIVLWIGRASWPLMKVAPISASAAEVVTLPIESGVGSERQERIQGPVTKKVLAACTTAGLCFWDIGDVTMDVKHHIACTITYGGVRVWGRVIEESKCLFVRFLGGFGLLGSDRPKGSEHFRVNINSVIQQGSDNFLDQGDVFGGEQRGDVVGRSILK